MHDPPPDGDGRPAGFAVTTEQQEDVARVRARGELDLATAPTLCARVTKVIQRPATRIMLDLTELDFCDSQGLRAIVGLVREARAHAVQLAITVANGSQLARLIELTGTAEFLPITQSNASLPT
jgi:anti-sigma B factor antagonist